jgi:hypothetical protein
MSDGICDVIDGMHLAPEITAKAKALTPDRARRMLGPLAAVVRVQAKNKATVCDLARVCWPVVTQQGASLWPAVYSYFAYRLDLCR